MHFYSVCAHVDIFSNCDIMPSLQRRNESIGRASGITGRNKDDWDEVTNTKSEGLLQFRNLEHKSEKMNSETKRS